MFPSTNLYIMEKFSKGQILWFVHTPENSKSYWVNCIVTDVLVNDNEGGWKEQIKYRIEGYRNGLVETTTTALHLFTSEEDAIDSITGIVSCQIDGALCEIGEDFLSRPKEELEEVDRLERQYNKLLDDVIDELDRLKWKYEHLLRTNKRLVGEVEYGR